MEPPGEGLGLGLMEPPGEGLGLGLLKVNVNVLL